MASLQAFVLATTLSVKLACLPRYCLLPCFIYRDWSYPFSAFIMVVWTSHR